MSKFIGRLADIGIAVETTRGTAESSATYWLPKMSLTLDDTIEQVVDESSYGVIEDSPDAKVVKTVAEGEFEGIIGINSVGLILKSVFGTVSTGTAVDSSYTHTYSVQQDAQHDSLTLFQDDPNQDYSYPLGMITSWGLNVNLGEFATQTVGFRSKKGATGTHTPSYTAETQFLPQHGVVSIADTQADLGTTSETSVNVRSVSITVEKNVEDDDAIGSAEPVDILNTQMSIEGEVELVFDSETFKTEMLADTAKAMRIELENTGVTIGASTNPKLTIDLHKVKFSEFSRDFSNDDIVTASVSFKAFYNTTDSKMVTATLTNTVASY